MYVKAAGYYFWYMQSKTGTQGGSNPWPWGHEFQNPEQGSGLGELFWPCEGCGRQESVVPKKHWIPIHSIPQCSPIFQILGSGFPSPFWPIPELENSTGIRFPPQRCGQGGKDWETSASKSAKRAACLHVIDRESLTFAQIKVYFTVESVQFYRCTGKSFVNYIPLYEFISWKQHKV